MSCSCSNSPCSCSPCQPANTVYQGTCTDPGSATSLRHVLGLDSSFCPRRLLPNDGGYLVARATGSGGWIIDFTTEPVVPLSNVTAVQKKTFGQFIVQGSDNIMRTLTGPAIADLYPRTNAAGQITFDTLPPASVPDPLVVNHLTVVTNAKVADLQITGTATASGLGTGTLTNVLGIDGSNNIIKGTIAVTGSQCASFFESLSSPSPAGLGPNNVATAGQPLFIGNLLYDSTTPAGNVAGLFVVTNSKTLTCITAGTYVVDFGGRLSCTAAIVNTNKYSIGLSVNGIVVNSGNGTNNTSATNTTAEVRNVNLWGQNMRRFAVNDTIQLVVGSNSGANLSAYEVRCNVTRLGA